MPIAVPNLPADALALRAGPDHGTVGQLAAHLAGSRTFWRCGWRGEPGAGEMSQLLGRHGPPPIDRWWRAAP